MEKVPTATCALRDRYIVSIERVYTPSAFYMKLAVSKSLDYWQYDMYENKESNAWSPMNWS